MHWKFLLAVILGSATLGTSKPKSYNPNSYSPETRPHFEYTCPRECEIDPEHPWGGKWCNSAPKTEVFKIYGKNSNFAWHYLCLHTDEYYGSGILPTSIKNASGLVPPPDWKYPTRPYVSQIGHEVPRSWSEILKQDGDCPVGELPVMVYTKNQAYPYGFLCGIEELRDAVVREVPIVQTQQKERSHSWRSNQAYIPFMTAAKERGTDLSRDSDDGEFYELSEWDRDSDDGDWIDEELSLREIIRREGFAIPRTKKAELALSPIVREYLKNSYRNLGLYYISEAEFDKLSLYYANNATLMNMPFNWDNLKREIHEICYKKEITLAEAIDRTSKESASKEVPQPPKLPAKSPAKPHLAPKQKKMNEYIKQAMALEIKIGEATDRKSNNAPPSLLDEEEWVSAEIPQPIIPPANKKFASNQDEMNEYINDWLERRTAKKTSRSKPITESASPPKQVWMNLPPNAWREAFRLPGLLPVDF